MAKEGAAVVIVARRPDVLDQAAQEIMTPPRVRFCLSPPT